MNAEIGGNENGNNIWNAWDGSYNVGFLGQVSVV
jgi:hypothetical protein